MPVVDTDIVVYGSANMRETDSGTQGGARDPATLVVFAELIGGNTTITVVSNNAGDAQNLTVTGRIADGSIVDDIITLTGNTPAVGAVTFERVLKMVLSATAAGTVTVTETTGSETIVAMPTGITTVRRPFYNVSADVSGGAQRIYYEKIFFENENATSALTNATISEQGGSVAANIDFALEATLDGSDTTTNRITNPPAGYTFDSATKNVTNSQNHTPQTAQGVWLRLTLADGTAATNGNYQLREAGQTV